MSAPNNNIGAFVNTTQVWDVSTLYNIDVNSEAFKELMVRLYQQLNNFALALNIKDSGYYDNTLEFVNGQLYFPNPASPIAYRQVTRFVVNFGALPNATTKSVAHGLTITTEYTFTRIYATASDTTDLLYIPIPYASNTAGHSVELSVDATNVNITTGINLAKYNVCYVVLEYLIQ